MSSKYCNGNELQAHVISGWLNCVADYRGYREVVKRGTGPRQRKASQSVSTLGGGWRAFAVTRTAGDEVSEREGLVFL